MIRQTSLEAFKDLPVIHVNRQEKAILKFVNTRKDCTRREIAKALSMETSTVSARVNHMVKYGVLDEYKKRKCRVSGKMVNVVSSYSGQAF